MRSIVSSLIRPLGILAILYNNTLTSQSDLRLANSSPNTGKHEFSYEHLQPHQIDPPFKL